MEITKQQAITLWYKFIQSDNVRKENAGYGPGGYMQFMLVFQNRGCTIEKLNLITNGIYHEEPEAREITEYVIKKLYTPYGDFDLTIEEATKLRDSWVYRDKSKEHLKYQDLLQML